MKLALALALVGLAISLAGCGTVYGDPIVAGDAPGSSEGGAPDAGPAAPGPAGEAGSDAGAPSFGPPCPRGQWCWASPRPTGEDVVGVYATQDGRSTWAVTETASVLHTDATGTRGWTTAYTPSADVVATDIFGVDDAHVWIGYGAYLGASRKVVGAKLGASGGVLAWDGTHWRSWTSSYGPVVSVWASTANELWVATPTWVWVLDGTTMVTKAILAAPFEGLGSDIVLVDGAGPDDVRVALADGTTVRWKGTRPFADDAAAWSVERLSVPSSNPWSQFVGLWHARVPHLAVLYRPTQSQTKLAFYRLQPGGWELEATDEMPDECRDPYAELSGHGRRVIARTSAYFEEAIIVPERSSCGWYGSDAGANGTTYTRARMPFAATALAASTEPGATPALYNLWAAGPSGRFSHAFAQTLYTGSTTNPSNWSPAPDAPREKLRVVSVDRSANVWAIGGDANVYRYDAAGVIRMPFDGASLHALAAVAADDVWVGHDPVFAGYKVLSHFDGRAWTAVDLPSLAGRTRVGVSALWASNGSDVWAIGGDEAPIAFHFDGSSWTAHPEAGSALYAIAGTGADNVWLGGFNGKVVRYDGKTFIDRSAGLEARHTVAKLVALPNDEAWALVYEGGSTATVRHFAGGTWASVLTPDPEVSGIAIAGIVGVASDDVWFVGMRGFRVEYGSTGWERGEALHWDGTSLTSRVVLAAGRALTDVTRAPDGRLWAVGVEGALVYATP
jgi:hypothetical protein